MLREILNVLSKLGNLVSGQVNSKFLVKVGEFSIWSGNFLKVLSKLGNLQYLARLILNFLSTSGNYIYRLAQV